MYVGITHKHNTEYLHCEPPLSRMVLKRDLNDAYKSGKFSSSKVNRRGGSVEEFDEITGGAADTEEWEGPDTVQTDTGAILGMQEKVDKDTGPELGG